MWIPFKYENLPMFCFGCERMGHGVKVYENIPVETKENVYDDFPYFIALKAKSNMIGKEGLLLGIASKKFKK